MELLEPVHHQAMATSRRLCRVVGDGDDLYQEAVLRAYDKLDSLRDPERFRSWFYAVLLSLHRTRYRRSFWQRFLPLASVEEPPAEATDGQRLESRRAGDDRAARALATLPAPQREAVVLFELDGFSIQEIAELQGVSVSAVKSRLTRGRDRLRRFYERRGWGGGEGTAQDKVRRVTDFHAHLVSEGNAQ